MIDLTSLAALPPLAARYIEEHGWVQGVEKSDKGEVCLTGALRLCSPVPGDGAIARAVLRRRGRAEDWNDFDGRTQHEVVGYLARTEITDRDLEEVFGPQWLEIVGIIRQAASATDAQIRPLEKAWAAEDADRDAAWDAATWAATRDVARAAAWAAAFEAARGAAHRPAFEALLATITRDLIGTDDYTQKHHDLLMDPWRAVFGKVGS